MRLQCGAAASDYVESITEVLVECDAVVSTTPSLLTEISNTMTDGLLKMFTRVISAQYFCALPNNLCSFLFEAWSGCSYKLTLTILFHSGMSSIVQ